MGEGLHAPLGSLFFLLFIIRSGERLWYAQGRECLIRADIGPTLRKYGQKKSPVRGSLTSSLAVGYP